MLISATNWRINYEQKINFSFVRNVYDSVAALLICMRNGISIDYYRHSWSRDHLYYAGGKGDSYKHGCG